MLDPEIDKTLSIVVCMPMLHELLADWGGLQHMRLIQVTSVADSPASEARAILLAFLVWVSLPRRR